MSTKIYNGYRIMSSNIFEIMRLLDDVGKAYDKAAKVYMATLSAHVMINAWDTLTLAAPQRIAQDEEMEDLLEYSVSIHTYQFIASRQKKIKATNRRDPVYDFQLDIIIFPEGGWSDTLAMVYTENATFKKAFEEHPLVEEFGYWDNSDRPEEVPEHAWNSRGERWMALVGDDVPSRRGLTRQYERQYGPEVLYSDILPLFPLIEHRAERWAEESLVSEYGEKVEAPAKDGVYSWLTRARAWAKEGTRLKDRIAKILPLMSNPTKEQISKFPEKK
jgi:hypothetical protein